MVSRSDDSESSIDVNLLMKAAVMKRPFNRDHHVQLQQQMQQQGVYRQMEQITEEIFFALSQDFENTNELNSHSHEFSTAEAPAATTLSAPAGAMQPLSLPNHRCVSASFPSRQQQPLFSRRGGGVGVWRKHAPQFANYLSPKELELLLHCSSGIVCLEKGIHVRTAERVS
jgi:hypothetical protein